LTIAVARATAATKAFAAPAPYIRVLGISPRASAKGQRFRIVRLRARRRIDLHHSQPVEIMGIADHTQ